MRNTTAARATQRWVRDTSTSHPPGDFELDPIPSGSHQDLAWGATYKIHADVGVLYDRGCQQLPNNQAVDTLVETDQFGDADEPLF